ncbi:MAG: STAS domain-containing protein [Actinomycetota bacterium]|nr:STAS domain-containing protein [Actinomycetota bacterium]
MNPSLAGDHTGNAKLLTLRTTRPFSGLVVVEARGDVDMSTSPRLYDALVAALDTTPTTLVLDLTDIDFFSSSGIAVLLRVHQESTGNLAHFHLVTLRSVQRVPGLVGLLDMFSMFDSREHASSEMAS